MKINVLITIAVILAVIVLIRNYIKNPIVIKSNNHKKGNMLANVIKLNDTIISPIISFIPKHYHHFHICKA